MSSATQGVTRAARIGGDLAPVRIEPMDQTRADRARVLEQQFGATIERSVQTVDGQPTVILGLRQPSGDVLVGRGTTTEAALTHLEARCRKAAEETPDA